MAEKHDNSESTPLTKLRDSMHALTVELETHRTHVHGFMGNQEVINKQLAEILAKQDARLRDIEHQQIRHDERIGRVEKEIAAVSPKLDNLQTSFDELKTNFTWWLGAGGAVFVVVQILIQVVPMLLHK